MWFVLKMMLRLLRLCGRARQDIVLENLVLRHQLAVVGVQNSIRTGIGRSFPQKDRASHSQDLWRRARSEAPQSRLARMRRPRWPA